MTACARATPAALFLYINVLFAVYSGAALSTSSRLAWDPTLYAAARELWPAEYRAAAAALPALGALLLALPALAVAAVLADTPHATATLISCYWCLEAVVVAGATWWLAWTGTRLARWSSSAQAAELRRVADLSDHLQPLLDQLDRWFPLPDTIKVLIQEARADLPRNGYVACAALGTLAVLLPAAAALALLIRMRAAALSSQYSDTEASRPLNKVGNGRLVAV